MTLGEYLHAACGRPWLAAVDDCCTFPAGWALTWGRGDPMAEWRGAYRSDAGAVRLISEAGGLLTLWQRGLVAIGVGEVEEPRAGDVGVVRALTDAGIGEVGAIFTGERWGMRAPSGVLFAPTEPLCVWGPRG